MSKFTEGMDVVVITDNSVVEGKIEKVFDEIEMVLVRRTENGELFKASFDKVGIIEKKVTAEEETPNEPEKEIREGAKVITRQEFIDALHEVTSLEGMVGEERVKEIKDPSLTMLKGLTIFLIGTQISDKLFAESEEIEITREELKEQIMDNTKPDELSNMIDNQMSSTSLDIIGLLSTLVLMKLVCVLFDETK